MTYLHLFELIEVSKLSFEDFGELVGVSGMTFRRWTKKPSRQRVPKLYVPAIREACYELLASGTITDDDPAVRALLAAEQSAQHLATANRLGLDPKLLTQAGSWDDRVLKGLSQLGSQVEKQSGVRGARVKLGSFKSIGKEWSLRISFLWTILQSKRFASIDKVIAYGALFYLLAPVDFIPDHIPLFGLMDDFGVLGAAVTYYRDRFPGLK